MTATDRASRSSNGERSYDRERDSRELNGEQLCTLVGVHNCVNCPDLTDRHRSTLFSSLGTESIEAMAKYCTYFDEIYLSRGELMIQSLLTQESDAEVFVLALSETAEKEIASRLGSSVRVVSLRDFEAARPDILATKAVRSPMEYVFTCTPGWIHHVLENWAADDEWVTYLDADLYFFSSPASIYAQLGSGSVGVVPHRFPWFRASLNRFGKFNVGWVSFRSSREGVAALRWWDERCVEWCFDYVDSGRFADQRYLDAVAERTETVVLQGAGVNLAPWNLGRHRVHCAPDGPLVDGQPVIFFHFHGLTQHAGRFYLKDWFYGGRLTRAVRECIYEPYLTALSIKESQASWVGKPSGKRRSGLGDSTRRTIARLVGDTVRLRSK